MTKVKTLTIYSFYSIFGLSIIGIIASSGLFLFNNSNQNLIAKATNAGINIEQKCYLKETNQACPTINSNGQQASYIKPDQEFIYQIRLINNTNTTIEGLDVQVIDNNNISLTMINDLSNKKNLEQNQKAEYYLNGGLTNIAKQSVVTGETIFIQNEISITTKSNITTNTSLQLVSNNKNNLDQITTSLKNLNSSSSFSSLESKSVQSTSMINSTSSSNSNTTSLSSTSTSSPRISSTASLAASTSSTSQVPVSSSPVLSSNISTNTSSVSSKSEIKDNILKINLTCFNKQNDKQVCTEIKNDADITYKIQVLNTFNKDITNSKLHIKHNIEEMVLESKESASNQSNFSVKNNESDKELEIPLIKANETLQITFDSLLKISQLQTTPIVTMAIVTSLEQSQPSISTYKIPKITNVNVASTMTSQSLSSSTVVTERAKITNLSVVTNANTNSASNASATSSSKSISSSVLSSASVVSSVSNISNIAPIINSSKVTSTVNNTPSQTTVRTGGQENLAVFSSGFAITGMMFLFLRKNLKSRLFKI